MALLDSDEQELAYAIAFSERSPETIRAADIPDQQK